MTLEDDVRKNLAQLFDGYRVDIGEKWGGDTAESPGYIILFIENVGLQIAREGDGSISFSIFSVHMPRQRWPIDYFQWLIEEVTDIPARLSNRPLHEWCVWVLKNFHSIDKALSETEYPNTALQLKQICEVQGERFNQAFARHPDILS